VIIETSAPTRVDLAGGTIDIPPLYLFHEGAATVNFALSIRAHCRIETRDDDRVFFESVDLYSRIYTMIEDLCAL
jgi:D-glycero-alpha-D-manno-heptose-7-phosphate kinase